jgi:cysteine desulfuration protein SufE
MNKACPEPHDETPAATSAYPPKLAAIVTLFEGLPDDEKRETLISYADQSKKCAPAEGETFDLEDVRKDEECTDTVGIYLRVDSTQPGRPIHFRVSLGPQVQILTKAMASILCKGLDGATIQAVLDLPADFVPRIVGGQLVRIRSQTVYYVLTRMKSAIRAFLNRERAAAG